MSYRSDVAICWKSEDYENFKSEFSKIDKDDWSNKWSLFRHCDYVYHATAGGNSYVVTVWTDVKWYAGWKEYENVNFVEELRKSHSSLFYRIGEDVCDIEEDWNEADGDNGVNGEMCEVLNVSRSFDISGDAEV